MDEILDPDSSDTPELLKSRDSHRDPHVTVANDTPELRRMKARERYRDALIKVANPIDANDKIGKDIKEIFEVLLEEDRGTEDRLSPVKETRSLSTTHGTKEMTRRPMPTVTYSVYLDDIIGVFDPRRETVAAAMVRLLPDLKRALRAELEYIADVDRDRDEVESARRLPDEISFQRLARYHLLGETVYKIAKDEAIRRDLNATESDYQTANVRRSIRSAATAVGHPEWARREEHP